MIVDLIDSIPKNKVYFHLNPDLWDDFDESVYSLIDTEMFESIKDLYQHKNDIDVKEFFNNMLGNGGDE